VKLCHEVVINAPVDTAWALLTDLQVVSPLLPGAAPATVDSRELSGTLSVKVGATDVRLGGTAHVVELDATDRRAVVAARGDSPTQGSAEAVITARMVPAGERTRVLLDTDLVLSGPLARFSRGVLSDAGARLVSQLGRALEASVTAGAPTAGQTGAGLSGSVDRAGPVDVGLARRTHDVGDNHDVADNHEWLGAAGAARLRRAAPVTIGVAVGALTMRWLMRRAR
jgi:uncharacterized protein